jgi:N-acyl homoserine lactone hydrolase
VLELGRFPSGGHPIPGFLIELEDGRRALIDSGFRAPRPGPEHDAVAAHLRATGFGAEDAAYLLTADGRRLLLDELARTGTEPDGIALVIQTHLDLDHSGNHDLFPRAEVVVQRAAVDAADRDTSQRSWPVRATSGPVHWRPLDGDATVAPGLDVVATPGHAPGHQSVLVHLPGGAVLLTGDAVFEAADWRPDRSPHAFDVDGPAAVDSTRRLLALAEQHAVLHVIFGHDPAQWSRIVHATYE